MATQRHRHDVDLHRVDGRFFEGDEAKDALPVVNEKCGESAQRRDVGPIRSLDAEPIWQLMDQGCAFKPVVFLKIDDLSVC